MRNACVAAAAVSRHKGIAGSTVLAVGLLLALIAIAALSQGFYYGIDLAQAPIVAFTGLLLAATLASLALPRLILDIPTSRWSLVIMLAIGLAMRWSLFDSTPILEIDFYRYLWDGAVTANGFNPYALPPERVHNGELSVLAAQAGPVFERINYRELSTIYPPLAQALFALAHWLDPWHANGLRYVYLVADLATLGCLLYALRRLHLSPCWSAIYWWNPLLIVLCYNGLHMDVLLLPWLAAALCLLIAHRPITAGAALVLASAIKLWPLLLLPFVLRELVAQPRRLFGAMILLALLAASLLLPMLGSVWSEHSGLATFGQHWQRNAVLFPQIVQLLDLVSDSAQWHARLLVGCALATLAFYLLCREARDKQQVIRHMALVVAALFLLSPVQLPWYCLWLLPFLCFYRNPALLLLLALTPIYYLRFHFDQRGDAETFDLWIAWLQLLPPLLLWWWNARQGRTVVIPRHA